MRRAFPRLQSLAALAAIGAVISARATPATAQRATVDSLELKSRVFGNSRTLRVLLPPGYGDRRNANVRYPVLYLNDGYAVFHHWDVAGTVERLVEGGAIEPVIVVGIDNAGEGQRAAEYLPYPDETMDPPLEHPRGAQFPDFLVKEVMPAVERRYRTKSGSSNTGLGGASYGAYIALYAAIQYPDTFGRLLLQSTPLYIADFRILDAVDSARALPERITIEVGSKETPDEEINRRVGANAKRLQARMLARSPSSRIRVVVDTGGEHNAEAWKRRLPSSLEFLFGRVSPQ